MSNGLFELVDHPFVVDSLRRSLEAGGKSVETEYVIETGRVDLYIPEDRAAIEVKALGNPSRTGFPALFDGEENNLQAERYAEASEVDMSFLALPVFAVTEEAIERAKDSPIGLIAVELSGDSSIVVEPT